MKSAGGLLKTTGSRKIVVAWLNAQFPICFMALPIHSLVNVLCAANGCAVLSATWNRQCFQIHVQYLCSKILLNFFIRKVGLRIKLWNQIKCLFVLYDQKNLEVGRLRTKVAKVAREYVLHHIAEIAAFAPSWFDWKMTSLTLKMT